MNLSEKELEEQLKEIGSELLKPPSSTDALLKGLDVRMRFPLSFTLPSSVYCLLCIISLWGLVNLLEFYIVYGFPS